MLILADDLTGALEVGAKLAAAEVPAQVKIAPVHPLSRRLSDAGALVIDTETRHVSSNEAFGRILHAARLARAEAIPIVYKKTDSTLRGNIGAELAAVIEAYAGSPLLYVPAYPKMGRKVRNGFLYVEGVLVGNTCFATDPLNPVSESHIPRLISTQCPLRVRSGRLTDLIDPEPRSIAVCDGETEGDVEAAARAFVSSSSYRLAAGPAPFAAHLARLADLPRGAPPPMRKRKSALIVSGSLNKISADQLVQAKRDGFQTIDSGLSSAGIDRADWYIFEHQNADGVISSEFGRSLAKSVCRILERISFDILVIFGGDTAYAIMEAMGHPNLHPWGEVLEGIPISRISARDLCGETGKRDHDLYLVTKAGGFGSPDVLSCIRNAIGER